MNKLIQDTDALLLEYLTFLVTEYLPKVQFGKSCESDTSIFNLRIFKKISEKQNNDKYSINIGDAGTIDKIYEIEGLGLTDIDFKTKDIGIGFGGLGGLKIYEYLLKKHTTLNDSVKIINKKGYSQVSTIFNNMKETAKYIAGKLSPNGNWKPTGFTYDSDIFDSTVLVEFTDNRHNNNLWFKQKYSQDW